MLLREKDKARLIDFFSAVPMPVEVLAYGSRVNGTAHDGSDLDLVIRSIDSSPLPRSMYHHLCEQIRDSNIPILVELRDWALLPASFKENIARQHELLFSSVPQQKES